MADTSLGAVGLAAVAEHWVPIISRWAHNKGWTNTVLDGAGYVQVVQARTVPHLMGLMQTEIYELGLGVAQLDSKNIGEEVAGFFVRLVHGLHELDMLPVFMGCAGPSQHAQRNWQDLQQAAKTNWGATCLWIFKGMVYDAVVSSIELLRKPDAGTAALVGQALYDAMWLTVHYGYNYAGYSGDPTVGAVTEIEWLRAAVQLEMDKNEGRPVRHDKPY
jgi:hypothetical protein